MSLGYGHRIQAGTGGLCQWHEGCELHGICEVHRGQHPFVLLCYHHRRSFDRLLWPENMVWPERRRVALKRRRKAAAWLPQAYS